MVPTLLACDANESFMVPSGASVIDIPARRLPGNAEPGVSDHRLLIWNQPENETSQMKTLFLEVQQPPSDGGGADFFQLSPLTMVVVFSGFFFCFLHF